MVEQSIDPEYQATQRRRGTRIEESFFYYNADEPRLGRRESEPHSEEISYMHDVLTFNFPGDRTIWDLHHYFIKDGEKLDIQFDISFFKGFSFPKALSSFRSEEHGRRVPDLAINVLSKSTWAGDVGIHVDICRMIGVKVYVVFSPFHVEKAIYKPPFLRAYVLSGDGEYAIHELRTATVSEDQPGVLDENAIIDLASFLPFDIGIEARAEEHETGGRLYRAIFLERGTRKILETRLMAQLRLTAEANELAEREKERAEREKERADKLEKELRELRKE